MSAISPATSTVRRASGSSTSRPIHITHRIHCTKTVAPTAGYTLPGPRSQAQHRAASLADTFAQDKCIPHMTAPSACQLRYFQSLIALGSGADSSEYLALHLPRVDLIAWSSAAQFSCLPPEIWFTLKTLTFLTSLLSSGQLPKSLFVRAWRSVPLNSRNFYLRVSAACLPSFFKSRSNISRSFFERTLTAVSMVAACSQNPPRDQRLALGCRINLAHPAIGGAVLARHQPLLDQSINGYADGSRRKPNLRADRIHRERPLMQKHFEDAEIGVAQLGPRDALGRVRDQRLKGFHEHEPEMNPGGVLTRRNRFALH